MPSNDADPNESLPAGQSETLATSKIDGSNLNGPLGDDASPPTTPIFLRPRGARPLQLQAPPEVRTGILTGQSAALVDALTKAIAERLAAALRPVVASTVDDLLPMLLTLGHVPGPDLSSVEQAGAKVAEQADTKVVEQADANVREP